MSIGPSQAQKNAQNTENSVAQQGISNSQSAIGQGNTALATGSQNVNSGTGFLNTILNGNQANTSALLAPTINADRATNQSTLQALSTLTPRGGGRSGTLFNAAYAPSAATTSMFNNLRGTAATTLPQIGLAQEGIGTGLLNTGNSALNTGLQGSQYGVQNQFQNTAYSNQLIASMMNGILGLATTPFGGGSASGGLLGGLPGLSGGAGGCWIAMSIYGDNDVRTHIVRRWLNGPFKKTFAGRITMMAYMTIGRQVALFVKRSEVLKSAFKPLFDIALNRAIRMSTFVEVG